MIFYTISYVASSDAKSHSAGWDKTPNNYSTCVQCLLVKRLVFKYIYKG